MLKSAAPPNPAGYDTGNWNLGVALAGQHDTKAAHRILGEPLRFPSHWARTIGASVRIQTHVTAQNWQSLLTEEPAAEPETRTTPGFTVMAAGGAPPAP